MIREVRGDDFVRLREIESAAGAPFRDIGMSEIADDQPPSQAELAVFQKAGTAWVWVEQDDEPLAYLLVRVVDDRAHIEQVSVDPKASRRGLGAELIERAEVWARTRNLRSLTLTTFRDVPWNRPYYQRLGFEVVCQARWTPGLRHVRSEESAQGLDRWPRVVMDRAIEY